MILRSLYLNNFGLFAGSCELDLLPRKLSGDRRTIVLVGGKNGAGKTTLLDGVRLALYGRRALGARVAQADYEEYLRKQVHSGAGANSAAVGLEFDYAEAGIVHRYKVKREWVIRGKSVIETLLLEKDGAAITTVPREEWHQFLQELIPPGVSQLFFFDGEKIREIADATDSSNEQLGEAVRGLLGMDLVERARTDLGLYIARHGQGDASDIASRLESVVRDLRVVEDRIGDLVATVAELASQRDSQARASELIRRRFVAEGGDAAAQRGRIESEREDVKRKIAHCEHQLKELANGLLPFAFAPRLLRRFKDSLSRISYSNDRAAGADLVIAALNNWKSEAVPKRSAEWSAKHWADLKRFLATWSERSKADIPHLQVFPDISDATATLSRLVEVETVVQPKAVAMGLELDALVTRLGGLESALARADTASAGYLLDELRLAEQKVGSTEANLRTKQEELSSAYSHRTMLERERRKLLDAQAGNAAADHRIDLAGRAAQVLATFERRLLERKLSQLRTEFVRHFNYIARKDDLIADVAIDAETFSATLIDKTGRIIPKTSLSAGEQQIYAVAMLWALAKTSGRPLPMIIDTPLARLDSEHRSNLVKRYFPHASHQVVLLSTDTEVDESLLADLAPSVSHSYRLDYEADVGRTFIRTGYFRRSQLVKEKTGALQ